MCEDAAKAREFVERLRRKRKTVKLDELSSCLATSDWIKIHTAIAPMLADGTLTPPRTAKSNGSVEHPLFEKYRIKDEPVPAHDLTILHPTLVTSSYLERHPVECDRWWSELLSLSAWLQEGHSERDATLRERCWEVFGNEKMFESRGFATCVRNTSGRELRELLAVRDDAPEDLPFVVSPGVENPANIVVSENRDPYLDIRSQLLVGHCMLFGVRVDAVVCGYGNKVRQSHGASLRFALESMHASQDVRVLYWGDIDRTGLAILAALCDEGLAEPFTAAYEAMMRAHRAVPRESPDGRDLPTPSLDGIFEDKLRSCIEAIAAKSLLLPQECVDFRAIGEAMR